MADPEFDARMRSTNDDGTSIRGMCWQAPRCGLAYVGIAKSASSSLVRALHGLEGEPVPWRDFHGSHRPYATLDAATRESRFAFTFVRNPVGRFVSAYRQVARTAATRPGREWIAQMPWFHVEGEQARFEAFLARCEEGIFDPHAAPQVEFVMNDGGEILDLDYIGRVETLDADWRRIERWKKLPARALPRMNVSPPALVEIDEGLRVRIRELYRDDCERFGY